MRLLKGDILEQKTTSDLLTVIKNRDIEGVSVVNQGKPALRARAIDTFWWTLIPTNLPEQLTVL